MLAVSAEARPAEKHPPVQVVEEEGVPAALEQCEDGLAPWADHAPLWDTGRLQVPDAGA